MAAGRVVAATGAKLMCETFPASLERGAGLPSVERLGYLAVLMDLGLERWRRRLRHAATLGLAAKRPTVDNLTSGTIVAVGAGEQER